MRWPPHSMALVCGSSVTSVRNGLPSTRPTNNTEACRETGNSGLVTLVGFENFGTLRSTRLLSGATWTLSGKSGCGIAVDSWMEPGLFEEGARPELVHPTVTIVVAATKPTSTRFRRGARPGARTADPVRTRIGPPRGTCTDDL